MTGQRLRSKVQCQEWLEMHGYQVQETGQYITILGCSNWLPQGEMSYSGSCRCQGAREFIKRANEIKDHKEKEEYWEWYRTSESYMSS